jgi:hypothetical protein
MRDLILLFVHLLTRLIRLAGPEGVRSVIAESVFAQTPIADLSSIGSSDPATAEEAWSLPDPRHPNRNRVSPNLLRRGDSFQYAANAANHRGRASLTKSGRHSRQLNNDWRTFRVRM